MATADKPDTREKETEFTPFMAKEPIRLSINIVKTMICVPAKNGAVCSDREALKFIMLCKARGLNPFEGDAFLLGYMVEGEAQFSLITAHQAFLKRAETHPEYDGMESGVIVRREVPDPNDDEYTIDEIIDLPGDFYLDGDVVLGGWATVFFKHRSHHMHKRVRLQTFSTGKSRWGKDPAGMIVKVAEADSLRSSFPTLCGGMYLESEMESIDAVSTPAEADDTNKRARRAALPAPAGPSDFDLAMAGAAHETVPAEPKKTTKKQATKRESAEVAEAERFREIVEELGAAFEAGEPGEIRAIRDRECGPDGTLGTEAIKDIEARCRSALQALEAQEKAGVDDLFREQGK